jgi:hypothetical protein
MRAITTIGLDIAKSLFQDGGVAGPRSARPRYGSTCRDAGKRRDMPECGANSTRVAQRAPCAEPGNRQTQIIAPTCSG